MPDHDYYYTIESPVRAPELKVKGSRFIAEIWPVRSKQDVEAQLAAVRKEFYDATHHCFAYRLGPTGALLRAADAGEPAGTAGKPILLVLTSQQLTDVLLIVTRYYGGTKLGTGGLARAYAESAQQAVSLSKILRIYLTELIEIEVLYEDLPAIERLLAHAHAEIAERIFLTSVTLKVAVRRSVTDHLLHEIGEHVHRANARRLDTAA
jgi:uncharacterized YigZ family protein